VNLEPARHARVDLGKAVDRGIVETHVAVVLAGQILDRGADLELAALRRVVDANIRNSDACRADAMRIAASAQRRARIGILSIGIPFDILVLRDTRRVSARASRAADAAAFAPGAVP